MLNGLRRTPPKENGLELGLNNNGHHKKEAVSPGAHSASSSHSNSSTPAPAPKKSSDEPQAKPATPKSGRSTPPGPGLEPPPGLKPGLPGPPYGIPGFPLAAPPGVNLPPAPTNGHGASNGDSYRFNDSVRAPPVGIPPSGKP